MNTLKKLRNGELSDYEKEWLKYYLECIFSEGSKIILFLIIFWLLGFIEEFLVALFMLMLVRTNGGGLHFKHYLSCFLVSFLVLYASIMIPKYLHFSTLCSAVILLLCSLISRQLVPIVSDSRPEPTKELISICRKKTTLIILAYILLICICPNHPYTDIGVWTIIIHTIQLVLAKFKKRRYSDEQTCQ